MKADGPSRAIEFLCSYADLPAKGERHEISAVRQTNLLAEISSVPFSHTTKSTISTVLGVTHSQTHTINQVNI
jgi:hypothetical protein